MAKCIFVPIARPVIAALLWSCLTVHASSQTPAETPDRSALRVCADPSGLPFSNDKGDGFENKVAELLARKLGVPLQYTWYPNSVGFLRNTLRARRCDLVPGIVSGAELVLSTNPYYRSSYVMVTRRADALGIDSIGDPRLAALRIGVTAGTPPADLVAQRGLMARVRPYHLQVDTRAEAPGKQMIDDLAAGQLDVAILWGPIGGYFARQHGDTMQVSPLLKEPKSTRMSFHIAMGVRPGEAEWKNTVNQLLQDDQGAINDILRAYGVPLLDARDNPLP
ncbi:substrate-binding domain-containing protein [Vineibacter terrae]|uniref:substrate-binding domain-containing protein n=1 Tax=Vineibacter terrae TaxID=2586908 RepID=UPI0015B6A1D8|nr:substrate-binding domain-containing protein [Vineibacter terrae]